jgi:Nucleotidyl transferase AbiEii toxin, Type IV TA system
MTQSTLPKANLELLNGWLRRAIQHPAASKLVLRGSILTLALCGQKARVPQDVDYLLLEQPFNAEKTEKLALEISRIPDHSTDLILESTKIIWADTPYPGLRANLIGRVHDGELQALQVDFACDDPLSMPPRMLEITNVGSVLTCALETLFAWKLHGLVEFGRGRWKPKDLFDLDLLLSKLEFDQNELLKAIDLAFSSRDLKTTELDDFRTRDSWGCSSRSGRTKWRSFQIKYGQDLDFLELRNRVREAVNTILKG